MASIIQGYEYDIFISYRQKDNKHDGWVTEFVNQLKGELESTFKEEISVYFDINPHDGLLETYDVDASLKDKLKCLVFIPIISRTYCDLKSFAWEHEFKAFINQASQDHFGLKVKLPNGNVATRILPIQIHDLHPEDKSLLEKALGGVLRAIEFIYKEPGVNKPLTADDDEKKNLNGTKYRIQINKVSNAIDEIIQSLKGKKPSSIDGRVSSDQPYHDKEEAKGRKLSGTAVINQKSKQLLVILLLVVLCGAVAFAAYKIIKGSEKANDIANLEKSIAVLPFINDSPEKENEYIWNGMMDEVISKLQKVKDFRVLSRTSTTQYNRPERPTVSDIAKKLRVNYIIEGSGQKYGNKIRLIVQLIGANGKENHLWAHSYDMELKDATEVFNIQSLIAQSVVTELKAVITPEEKLIIDRVPTTSLKAYDYYQRGKEEIWKFGTGSINKESIERAESLFKKSLEYDSTFARGYVGLAEVTWKKAHYKENADYWNQYMDSMFLLANKALSFDNNTDEAYIVRAGYYAQGRNDLNKAIEELDEALKINPNFWTAYQEKAKYYWWQNDLAKEIDNRYNASLLNHGAELPELLTTLGDAFVRAGFPDMADDYYLEALNLDGDSTKYLSLLARKELFLGKIEKSKELLDKISIRDTDYCNQSIAFNLNANFVSYYLYAHQLEKALKYINKLKYSGQVNQHLKNLTFNQVTYLYWVNAFWKFQDDNYANILEWRYKLITKPDFLSYIADDDYLALASIYSIKGDKGKAIKILQRFYQNTSRFDLSTVTILKNDPSLDNIRNDPEFQKTVNDVESKYQAEHERVKKMA